MHPYTHTGAMAQFAVLSEAQTGLKPTSLNLTEAGTIPLVGLTALVGLFVVVVFVLVVFVIIYFFHFMFEFIIVL